MKIQLETITANTNRTFSLMFNPRLSDLFYWHFHPEYELVYIEAPSGTRHVGEHISTYYTHDLVLIGSNIPHLNFDYGLKVPYRKVVVHFKKDFIESHLMQIPELSPLQRLFKRSRSGLAFKGKEIANIAAQLFDLEGLSPFLQYQKLLTVLMDLTTIEELELLHEKPYTQQYSDREQGRLRAIYAFIDKNYQRKIELKEMAALSNMSKEAFCRYYKKVSGYTFIEFLNRYRVSQAKRLLMAGKNVSDACFSSGFESLSYFNRTFKKVTGENPSTFRKRFLS